MNTNANYQNDIEQPLHPEPTEAIPVGNNYPGLNETQHNDEVVKRLQQLKDGKLKTDAVIEAVKIQSLSMAEKKCLFWLNFFGHICCALLSLLFGCWYTVAPKQAAIFQVFGKILFVKTEPGLYCSPIVFGRWITTVSTAIQTLKLEGSSVPDQKGAPMNVSAIVNYVVVDAIQASFAVQDLEEYIRNQALEVLRNVCAKFPYRHNDESQPSLLSDSKLIGVQLKEILQVRCRDAGVEITRMELMEFSYHVEVAQSLLQVQQAQAKIDARKLIVEGSVNIVNDALMNLQNKGIELNTADRADMAKKLMVITCSDHGNATPVLNV